MIIRLENPRAFSDIIGIISELVTEVKIKVNKADGMSVFDFKLYHYAIH